MSVTPIAIRLLRSGGAAVLECVARGVYDNDVDRALAIEFLNDPRHHIAVALDGNQVVGMASAVHYVHPDKAAQLFINEVAVAPSHHRRGIGTKLLDMVLAHGRALGCSEAWVATEPGNTAARTLYAHAGGVEDATPFVMYTFPFREPA